MKLCVSQSLNSAMRRTLCSCLGPCLCVAWCPGGVCVVCGVEPCTERYLVGYYIRLGRGAVRLGRRVQQARLRCPSEAVVLMASLGFQQSKSALSACLQQFSSWAASTGGLSWRWRRWRGRWRERNFLRRGGAGGGAFAVAVLSGRVHSGGASYSVHQR